MHNIPEEMMIQIREAIRRPEGTVEFKFTCPEIFDPRIPKVQIFKVASGAHVFILERDNDMQVKFYHSSPGHGTRVACIGLSSIQPSDQMFYAFTWSHKEIKLCIHPMQQGTNLIISKGVQSQKQFRVAADGSIVQLGEQGIEIMQVKIKVGGRTILLPTAIESWRDTIKATDILQSGKSDQGYIYEVVLCNLVIMSLVTGFETYFKKRFLELEKEGIAPNYEALINRVFTNSEREAGLPQSIKSDAEQKGVSFLKTIANSKINFQNFEECKRAYNKTYGLKFGDVVQDSNLLSELQKYIGYRHKIVHVSTMTTTLNEDNSPPEEPVFSNKNTASKALQIFDSFVQQVHNATLRLQRVD